MAVVYLSISVILFMTLPFVREQKKTLCGKTYSLVGIYSTFPLKTTFSCDNTGLLALRLKRKTAIIYYYLFEQKIYLMEKWNAWMPESLSAFMSRLPPHMNVHPP